MEYSWQGAENWMSVLLRPMTRWKLLIAWSERCGRWASPAMLIRKGIPQRMSHNQLPSIPGPRSSLERSTDSHRDRILIWHFASLCVSNPKWLEPLPSSFVASQSCHENWTDLPKGVCVFWRAELEDVHCTSLEGMEKVFGSLEPFVFQETFVF